MLLLELHAGWPGPPARAPRWPWAALSATLRCRTRRWWRWRTLRCSPQSTRCTSRCAREQAAPTSWSAWCCSWWMRCEQPPWGEAGARSVCVFCTQCAQGQRIPVLSSPWRARVVSSGFIGHQPRGACRWSTLYRASVAQARRVPQLPCCGAPTILGSGCTNALRKHPCALLSCARLSRGWRYNRAARVDCRQRHGQQPRQDGGGAAQETVEHVHGAPPRRAGRNQGVHQARARRGRAGAQWGPPSSWTRSVGVVVLAQSRGRGCQGGKRRSPASARARVRRAWRPPPPVHTASSLP